MVLRKVICTGTIQNDMSVTPSKCRVLILVKALPQPSTAYGETVCCAGVTAENEFKRLFPIRFRHLTGDASFKRWDWVTFSFTKPTRDKREESCRVHEESIIVDGRLSGKEKAHFLSPLVSPSVEAIANSGKSLGLIRPLNSKFSSRRRTLAEINEEKATFEKAAKQLSIFDDELAALEPTPYEFRFQFNDGSGPHNYRNGDWEAHAMFWAAMTKHGMSEAEALDWMDQVFNVDYPQRGMMFAVGNMMKRPQTWQLLGVLRVDLPSQEGFLL